ncbi:MAG: tetratricopeptide repeat protein [Pseudomonadota bacterium]
MDLARERRLNQILTEALGIPEDAREVWVRAQCEDDPSLADEVMNLLADDVGTFLEPAARLQAKISNPVGAYELIEPIGEGGMGEVYFARPVHGPERKVAVKLLRVYLDSQSAVRFRAEQQALARLEHDAIARLQDNGMTDDGRPWFAMEYVPGEPITKYCERRSLALRERLELFLVACRGVAHAHQRQVLHRDLKPSNILALDNDPKPIVKLIDFGIAKALDRPLTDVTLLTETGVIGTPAYLSPEVLAQGGQAVDTRADVYSLGVILYELLCGQRPWADHDHNLVDLIRSIETHDPPTASSRLRKTLPDQRSPGLPERLDSDLDWITQKATATDPEQRYGSVAELAADVERYLANEPVLARAPTLGYRLRKFARRRTGVVVAACAIVLAVVIGGAGLIVGLREAREETRVAQAALQESEAMADFVNGLFSVASPGESLGQTITAREILDRGAVRVRESFPEQPILRAKLMGRIADIYSGLALYDQADLLVTEGINLLAELPDVSAEDRAVLLRSRGLLAINQRDYERALADYEHARALFEQAYPASPDANQAETLAGVVHNAGVGLFYLGRYDEAQERWARALELRRAHLPEDHPHLSRSFSALAALARMRGDNETARSIFQEALTFRERALGPDHPNVAMALYNVAFENRQIGEFDEALAQLNRALHIQETTLPERHPDLIRTVRLRGLVNRDQRNWADAERDMTRLISLLQEHRDPESEDIPRARVSLAITLQRSGDARAALDIAEPLLKQLHDRSDEVDGLIVSATGVVGISHWQLGNLETGREWLLEARRLGIEANGTGPWVTWGLAGVHEALGQPEAAEHWYAEAWAMVQAENLLVHDITDRVRRDYVAFLDSAGRPSDAEAVRDTVW